MRSISAKTVIPLRNIRIRESLKILIVWNIVLVVTVLLFLLPATTHAATLYWVGGNGDSVNTNANDWSTSNPGACNDGGGDAGAVPGASDIAVFDADCDNNALVDERKTPL